MKLQFTKMQGIGNDFVVIDAINQSLTMNPALARKIADRRYGIGCDQILLVEHPHSEDAQFRYRILNADGSEVGQCGNGARCFARFVQEKGLTDLTSIPVETIAGKMVLHLQENGDVTVDMGTPVLTPGDIPFNAPQRQSTYPLKVAGEIHHIGAVSMGNPHAVLTVEDVLTAPVEELGQAIESHEDFPERVNVGFMQIVSPDHIKLRVFERGAGETLACGSGACAAVVSGIVQGVLEEKVRVELPGGQLMVKWAEADAPVMLTGPAETVFEGTIEI